MIGMKTKKLNYIEEYYQKIQNKEIIAGKWITLWYKRVLSDLKKEVYFYDSKKANKAIKFIEKFCRHSQGEKGGQLFELELWQKAMLAILFGCVDKNGYRQFRECLCIVGRKNGKTALAAAIAEYMTYADGEYGSNTYIVAPKLLQAAVCYEDIYQSIKLEPELYNISKKRRSDIYVNATNSTILPIAFAAKKSDGLNPQLVICDEIASWAGENGLKQYEVLKSACGSRRQPLILSITTAGYVDDGIYDELMKRATAILIGNSNESKFAPFLYMIDDLDKWEDINELKKANPNYGVSIYDDYLIEEINVANLSFSKKAEFLCKYCNIKQNSANAWFSSKMISDIYDRNKPIKPENYKKRYAVVGVDLSRTTDLTSAVCLIEDNDKLYCLSHFWLPTEKLQEHIEYENIPYQKYIDKGELSLSGDNMINYSDIVSWIEELRRVYNIIPLMIGYDKYSSNYFVKELKDLGYRSEPIIQGPALTTSIDELEGRVLDKSLYIGNNTLMKMHLLDTALKITTDGKKQIVKVAPRTHIDGTAALLDAIAVRRYYPETKEQLRNNHTRT